VFGTTHEFSIHCQKRLKAVKFHDIILNTPYDRYKWDSAQKEKKKPKKRRGKRKKLGDVSNEK